MRRHGRDVQVPDFSLSSSHSAASSVQPDAPQLSSSSSAQSADPRLAHLHTSIASSAQLDDPFTASAGAPQPSYRLRAPPELRQAQPMSRPTRKSSFGATASRRPDLPSGFTPLLSNERRPRAAHDTMLGSPPSLFAQIRSFGSRTRGESCNGSIEATHKPQRPPVLRRSSSGTLITAMDISAPLPTIASPQRFTLSPPSDSNDAGQRPSRSNSSSGQRIRLRPSREPIAASDADDSDVEAIVITPPRQRQASSSARHYGSPSSNARSRMQSSNSARMPSLGVVAAETRERTARVTLVDGSGPRDAGSIDFGSSEGASVVLGSESDIHVELRCVPGPAIDGCTTKMQWVLHITPSDRPSRSASPLPTLERSPLPVTDRSPQSRRPRQTITPPQRTPRSPSKAVFGSAPRSPRRAQTATVCSPVRAGTETPRMSSRSTSSPSPQTPDEPHTPSSFFSRKAVVNSGLGLNAHEPEMEHTLKTTSVAKQLFPRHPATPGEDWHSYGGYLSDAFNSNRPPPLVIPSQSLATRRNAELPRLDLATLKSTHLDLAPLTSLEKSRFSDTETEGVSEDDL